MRIQLSYRDHIITPDGNKCSCGLTGWFHDSPLSAIPPFATLIIEVCFSPQDEVETESHVQLDVIDGFCIFRKNITVRQNEATSTTTATLPITTETITTEGPATTTQTTGATTTAEDTTVNRTDISGVSSSSLDTRAISAGSVVVAIAVLAVLVITVGFVVYCRHRAASRKKLLNESQIRQTP